MKGAMFWFKSNTRSSIMNYPSYEWIVHVKLWNVISGMFCGTRYCPLSIRGNMITVLHNSVYPKVASNELATNECFHKYFSIILTMLLQTNWCCFFISYCTSEMLLATFTKKGHLIISILHMYISSENFIQAVSCSTIPCHTSAVYVAYRVLQQYLKIRQ